jgi:SAM-dependent methyltransferase
MIHARAYTPEIVKRLVWNFKHKNRITSASFCPDDFLKVVVPQLRSHYRVLDLGCAQGNLLAALRLSAWDGEYIGVDISQKAIDVAKKIGDKNAQWFVSSIEDFPHIDADVVCFLESLYYVRNVPAVISRWSGANIYIRIVHSDRHRDCMVT